jgi:hypothetical protein
VERDTRGLDVANITEERRNPMPRAQQSLETRIVRHFNDAPIGEAVLLHKLIGENLKVRGDAEEEETPNPAPRTARPVRSATKKKGGGKKKSATRKGAGGQGAGESENDETDGFPG